MTQPPDPLPAGPRGAVIGDIWNEPPRRVTAPEVVELERRERRRQWATNALAFVPAVLVGTRIWVELLSYEYRDGDRPLITTTNPSVVNASWSAALILMAAVSVWSLLPRRLRGPGKAAVMLGGIAGVGLWFVSAWFPWTRFTPTVNAPDGTSWRVRFAWEGSMGLDRVVSQSWLRTVGEHVASDGWGRSLVLPAGAPQEERSAHVRFAPTGMVLVVSGATCWVAFDPTAPPDGRSVDIPPFVLLGDGEQGTEVSVLQIEHQIRESTYLAPSEPVLLDALGSPNPWIVEAARRFIRAGGATLYPEATKRL